MWMMWFKGPDFGVKESAEPRYLDAFGQRLAEPLLDFRHRTGCKR